jgi:hypothetical protein
MRRVELMYVSAHEFIMYALWPLIRDLLHLRQPRGVVRITAFAEVFIGGVRTPLDRATVLFVKDNT